MCECACSGGWCVAGLFEVFSGLCGGFCRVWCAVVLSVSIAPPYLKAETRSEPRVLWSRNLDENRLGRSLEEPYRLSFVLFHSTSFHFLSKPKYIEIKLPGVIITEYIHHYMTDVKSSSPNLRFNVVQYLHLTSFNLVSLTLRASG
jgi:hypothetical protein